MTNRTRSKDMHNTLTITEVRFTAAPAHHAAKGLLGFITCVLDGRLRLDGIALRRTLAGKLTLSFPSRRDGEGRSHAYIRPIDDATRVELEEVIFSSLPGAAASQGDQ